MVKLERMDWENVKTAAEEELRRVLIGVEVNTAILQLSERKLESISGAHLHKSPP